MYDMGMHNNHIHKHCYIKTYGCQMNVYDSIRMGEHLANAGYVATKQAEKADIIILNTCHIREKAAEKIYSELGRLKHLKTMRPDIVLAVAGCVAQAEGEEIISRAPMVDMVFGPQTFQALPDMLAELMDARKEQSRPHIIRTAFPAAEKFAHLRQHKRHRMNDNLNGFVTIQEGCDKFCTFCVVPYTRGGEISRAADDIIAEARELADNGVCEITLLGQNVNAWQDADGARLADLLARLHDIEHIARLRFTTSHPRDMDNALIAAFGNLPKLMPYLHLPIQSGADEILRIMGRRHTVSDYIDIIAACRKARPDIAISSDFIVGFPGESDTHFEDTMQLIRTIGFAQAFSFKYSPRPGTPSATHAAQIGDATKSTRLTKLQALLNSQQKDFLSAQIDRVLPILFEKRGRSAHNFSGRSPYLQPVHVTFADRGTDFNPIGKILPIKITHAHDNSLRGIHV